MEGFVLARIVHILAIIFWIGGVAMVTMVLIPAIRKDVNDEDKVSTFNMLEDRFARLVKFAVLLAGASGFYMLYFLDAWQRYTELRHWWLHAMTLVWIIFMLVLFVLEPLFLKRLFIKYGEKDPVKVMGYAHRLHWVLLGVSVVTIVGAMAGSHGWFFF